MIKRRWRKFVPPYYDSEQNCYCFPLNENEIAYIDSADFDLVKDTVWRAEKGKYTTYAVHREWQGKGEKELRHYMHRIIANAGSDTEVDHIDGNGLNNRRSNLRITDKNGNMANRQKNARGTSRFKGVSRMSNGRWRAYIQVRKKLRQIGTFNDEELAAKAYDIAAREGFGEFARPNFPDMIFDKEEIMSQKSLPTTHPNFRRVRSPT